MGNLEWVLIGEEDRSPKSEVRSDCRPTPTVRGCGWHGYNQITPGTNLKSYPERTLRDSVSLRLRGYLK
jgi:hypothetical protein